MGTALVSIAFGLTASLLATGASAQATLNSVKQKGFLTCGSNTGLAGFGQPDAQGSWTGLDVDLCRAIAAAIFDDPTKVRFIPLAAKDRFTALQSGEVDVLSRTTLDVLRLLAEGASNKLIARRLGISFHTAKFHVASIAAKLDATGRTDAVAQAVRLGLSLL
ncbi:LuxR family transcriptional regulator [Microvirga sp. 0TCS3.31]